MKYHTAGTVNVCVDRYIIHMYILLVTKYAYVCMHYIAVTVYIYNIRICIICVYLQPTTYSMYQLLYMYVH